MDIITDLTARAISHISVYQNICNTLRLDSELSDQKIKDVMASLYDAESKKHKTEFIRFQNNYLEIDKRIDELRLKSEPIKSYLSSSERRNTELEAVKIIIIDDFLELCETVRSLANFLTTGPECRETTTLSDPFVWTRCIRHALYENQLNRIKIAYAMGYIPLLVLLGLGADNEEPRQQRILQAWGKTLRQIPGKGKDGKPTGELKTYYNWWATHFIGSKFNKTFIRAKKEEKINQETALILKEVFNDNTENEILQELHILHEGIKSDPILKNILDGAPEPHKTSEGFPELTRQDVFLLFLTNSERLLRLLKLKEVPLPFEALFNEELNEIQKARTERKKDDSGLIGPPSTLQYDYDKKDPLKRAANMNLKGLAFSGGGIRSATFNLGVLQKLAENNDLGKFDYLSTVSGGGYIGSWLVSWIQRAGSVSKVADRLNPEKCTDPMAEEVRPIRWLRMYSNYLSPNTGIMSGDAWTVGMTWIRNALVNLLILLLLLFTALSLVSLVFQLWDYKYEFTKGLSLNYIITLSSILLLIGGVITGIGMSAFDREQRNNSRLTLGLKDRWLPTLLIAWATLAGYLTSSWMYGSISFPDNAIDQGTFAVIGIIAFLAMVIISIIGRYHIQSYANNQKELFWLMTFISSLVAAAIGILCLLGVSNIFEKINNLKGYEPLFNNKLAFILGLPMILETISICVVVRMLLMGNLFSDERREWWGRTGGVVHRYMLIWLVISAGALILPELFAKHLSSLQHLLPEAIATWSALVGTAVKLAFSSTAVGDKPVKGSAGVKEIFITFAPYLFMLGFLLLGSAAFNYLLEFVNISKYDQNNLWKYLAISCLLAGITYIITRRAGVNEFSLHHFYRNRLTRAYLGATQRRFDRDKTANSFTGFDRKDDLKIGELCFDKHEYIGPYPLINTTLNATTVSALDRQDRKAESFIFSPLYCGFDFSVTKSAAETSNGVFQYGYRPTLKYAENGGPSLGSAMAISGAAVNPNMGYHSSAPTAFLLTVFNVRLGKWIGNPRLKNWKRSDPRTGIGYLAMDMMGRSDIEKDYICLSDGGHFDNMGIYELVRRKCRYILLCDAEEDTAATCEGLANAIRRCRIDFGVEINIDTSEITSAIRENGLAKKHIISGTIKYPDDDSPGLLHYIKSSMTGDESVDIKEYHLNNEKFPNESTGDQFFNEAQFESYRKLGYHSVPKRP